MNTENSSEEEVKSPIVILDDENDFDEQDDANFLPVIILSCPSRIVSKNK
jgi:hypothetical protein